MTSLDIVEASADHAADMADVIRRSFAARPPLDPPAPALTEDPASVAAAIAVAGGLVAEFDGAVVGALLFDDSRPGLLGLRRVSVDPDHQAHGVASAMVGVAEDIAAGRGVDGLWLWVREELPETVRFWLRRGYFRTVPREREGPPADGVHGVVQKALPAHTSVPSAGAMQELAARVAALLEPGDLLILRGELGAGKTTFTQGLGEALGVRGPITSPTFVLSRIHPSLVGGPDLVHVDAYRLGSAIEVDDLDLDATSDTSVTVVEWGSGVAEQLSESRLEISISAPSDGSDTRSVTVVPHGPRWARVGLRSALERSHTS
ncbi:MAG: tRNA (adenosine(37)-N6)-threonylcarbamoyltransferase complex ATPase subunit type 1 TsaE [Aeromicrobium sp.]